MVFRGYGLSLRSKPRCINIYLSSSCLPEPFTLLSLFDISIYQFCILPRACWGNSRNWHFPGISRDVIIGYFDDTALQSHCTHQWFWGEPWLKLPAGWRWHWSSLGHWGADVGWKRLYSRRGQAGRCLENKPRRRRCRRAAASKSSRTAQMRTLRTAQWRKALHRSHTVPSEGVVGEIWCMQPARVFLGRFPTTPDLPPAGHSFNL